VTLKAILQFSELHEAPSPQSGALINNCSTYATLEPVHVQSHVQYSASPPHQYSSSASYFQCYPKSDPIYVKSNPTLGSTTPATKLHLYDSSLAYEDPQFANYNR
jgi:hypothetical protein